MWYRLDVKRLAAQTLPPVMRSGVTLGLLNALTAPLRLIYKEFKAAKDATDEELGTTCNVASMEAALNRLFRLRDGQISIESPEWEPRDSVALYLKKEELGTARTLRKKGEEGKKTYMTFEEDDAPEKDFTVAVPTFLCTSAESRAEDRYGWKNLSRIRQTVNRYKPAGRTFGIKLYDYE